MFFGSSSSKKRTARSFSKDYFSDKKRAVAKTKADEDNASVFSDATELDGTYAEAANMPRPKQLLPTVREEQEMNLGYAPPLPFVDQPEERIPVEAQRHSRTSQQQQQQQQQQSPSILPSGSNDVNLNVKFQRNNRPRMNVDPEYYDNKSYRYNLSKQTEQSRDLYFIKLVAGGLGKKFLELVEVIDTTELGPEESRFISSTYKYNDMLLKAWASAMELVKSMMGPGCDTGFKTTESLYEHLIENDSFVVALADYVAYKISTRNRGAIIRGRTRYEIERDASVEDKYLLALMKPLHYCFGLLDKDLVADYF